MNRQRVRVRSSSAQALLVAVAVACAGCGGGGDAGDDGGADAGDDAGMDAGGDDAGMDAGDDGSDGGGSDAGGDDGGGSDAGGDASTDAGAIECPAVAPSHGDSCTDTGLSCTYMSCDDFGVARGVCSDGAWDVETEACSEITCGAMTCEAGQLCKRQVGGAVIASCEDNPCGTGPIVPECACELCGGFECTVNDLTVDCNTCPGGGCP